MLIELLAVTAMIGLPSGIATRVAVNNYRSHDPDRIAQKQVEWYINTDFAKPPAAIDWKRFEQLTSSVMEQSRDPSSIDGQSLLVSFEEGVLEQQTLQRHVDANGWHCASCKITNKKDDYQCQHCGNGFRGGGPFMLEAITGEGASAVFTNNTNRTIKTSAGMNIHPGEAYALMPNEIVRLGDEREQHDFYDQGAMTRAIAAIYSVPPHHLGDVEFNVDQKADAVAIYSRKESGLADSLSARPRFFLHGGKRYICPSCGHEGRTELTHCAKCNKRIHWR